MRTYQQAAQKARAKALRTGEPVYIVYDYEACWDERSYCVATDEELCTYFRGAEPLACFDPECEPLYGDFLRACLV